MLALDINFYYYCSLHELVQSQHTQCFPVCLLQLPRTTNCNFIDLLEIKTQRHEFKNYEHVLLNKCDTELPFIL